MIVVDTANQHAEEGCLHNTTLLNASSEYIWAMNPFTVINVALQKHAETRDVYSYLAALMHLHVIEGSSWRI